MRKKSLELNAEFYGEGSIRDAVRAFDEFGKFDVVDSDSKWRVEFEASQDMEEREIDKILSEFCNYVLGIDMDFGRRSAHGTK